MSVQIRFSRVVENRVAWMNMTCACHLVHLRIMLLPVLQFEILESNVQQALKASQLCGVEHTLQSLRTRLQALLAMVSSSCAGAHQCPEVIIFTMR
jgi:hypothetical protein